MDIIYFYDDVGMQGTYLPTTTAQLGKYLPMCHVTHVPYLSMYYFYYLGTYLLCRLPTSAYLPR